MKKLLLSAALLSSSFFASADYVHSITLDRVIVGAETQIVTYTSVSNTCSYFGAKFKFDSTTPEGKSILSLVLLAKATGQPVSIWYTPATVSGDENSGCNGSKLAVVHTIAMY